MKNAENPLETLQEIKNLMEKSARFLSLSGFSGVYIGVYALLGACVVAYFFGIDLQKVKQEEFYTINVLLLIGIALVILMFSISTSFYLSWQKAKVANLPFWNKTAFVWLESLLVPLVTGGLFCSIMILQMKVTFVPSATLIFYGLAVHNCSQHSYKELKWLGISQILLGLISTLFVKYSLIFWALGFGVFHILYGILMYVKYEK